jgi:hypothetical protein
MPQFSAIGLTPPAKSFRPFRPYTISPVETS